MNRQRFAVVIVAIIGIMATFLPWYRIELVGSVSGLSSSGWFTFIMFILSMIFALRNNVKEDMSQGMAWIASVFSLLASFVVLWRMIDLFFAKEGMFSLGGKMTGLMGSQVSVAYGAWIVVIAGICVPFAAFLFRNRTFRRV